MAEYKKIVNDFSSFRKASGKIRTDLINKTIHKNGVFENLTEEERKYNDKLLSSGSFVECLVAYGKKGNEAEVRKYIENYFKERGFNVPKINSAGVNQLIVRVKEIDALGLSVSLDTIIPDLLSEPSNPYITNNGGQGYVKISPVGISFNRVLDKTAKSVDLEFKQYSNTTPGGFAESMRNMAVSISAKNSSLHEVAILRAISENFFDKNEIENYTVNHSQATKATAKLGKFGGRAGQLVNVAIASQSGKLGKEGAF